MANRFNPPPFDDDRSSGHPPDPDEGAIPIILRGIFGAGDPVAAARAAESADEALRAERAERAHMGILADEEMALRNDVARALMACAVLLTLAACFLIVALAVRIV